MPPYRHDLRRAAAPTSILLLLAAACAAAPAPTAKGTPEPPARRATAPDTQLQRRLAELDGILEAERAKAGVPGMALAIVRGGEVTHVRGYGYRDVARGLPVTSRTQFAIGSSTKAFTALAVLVATERAGIGLDDSPRKCLPYFQLSDERADADITVRDLLTHRSGLSRTDVAWTAAPDLRPEQVIRIAGKAKAAAGLGEKFNYQNVMYAAAGECAAAALGTSYVAAIEDEIFAPLGMDDSNLTVDEMRSEPNHAVGYDLSQGSDGSIDGVTETEMLSLGCVAPAGAINSHVEDMARWVRFMLAGGELDGVRIVSRESFAELTRKHMKISSEAGYGLGWFVDEWHGKRRVHHGGNVPGFSAMVSMLPDDDIGFVLLSNASNVPLRDVVGKAVFSLALEPEQADELLAELRGEPEQGGGPAIDRHLAAGPKRRNRPSSADQPERVPAELAHMADLVGTYESADRDDEAQILVRDRKIMLDPPLYPPGALVEQAKDRYTLEDRPGSVTIEVRRDRKGRVAGFSAKMLTREIEFDRAADAEPIRITAAQLLARVVRAHGARKLAKLDSVEIRGRATLVHEGLTAGVLVRRQAPNRRSETLTLEAFGEPIATVRELFDGEYGVTEQGSRPPERKRGKALANARLSAAFNPLLDHDELFETVTIKRRTTLDGEPVYVVEKTPGEGDVVVDWVSARTFRVLRRDRQQSVGGGSMTFRTTERFREYRRVKGVLFPFRIVQTSALGPQQTIVEIDAVDVNVELDVDEFRPRTQPAEELIEVARVRAPVEAN